MAISSTSAVSDAALRAGVIGYPVMHSRSPAIHLAAARAIGVDLDYRPIPVRPEDLDVVIAQMRSTGLRGLSVTMPHKEAVLPLLDELTPAARELGAVNHITNTDGTLAGNNTDGDGFLLGIRRAHGVDVEGKQLVIIGNGGAARAIIRSCALAGAVEIGVVGRSRERVESAIRVAPNVASVASGNALGYADIVVNATPVGMAGGAWADDVPMDVSVLRAGTVVIDIVYNPVETPLLRAARARDLPGIDGLSMLAGQAAEQFSTWTGVEAPLDIMIEAARAEPRKCSTP